MKKQFVTICMLAVLAGGCSEGLLVGGGVAAGSALSNTLAGAEKDLEVREQQLIELYNQGVEQGMEVEKLEQLKQQIYDIRLAKQTIKEGKGFLDVDFSDPKQTGGAISLAIMLGYSWLKRKELSKTMGELHRTQKKSTATDEAINKFTGTHDPQIAGELHDIIKTKTANI